MARDARVARELSSHFSHAAALVRQRRAARRWPRGGARACDEEEACDDEEAAARQEMELAADVMMDLGCWLEFSDTAGQLGLRLGPGPASPTAEAPPRRQRRRRQAGEQSPGGGAGAVSAVLCLACRNAEYQEQMLDTAAQLLRHCCGSGWACTAEELVRGAGALGVAARDVVARAERGCEGGGEAGGLLARAVACGREDLAGLVLGWMGRAALGGGLGGVEQAAGGDAGATAPCGAGGGAAAGAGELALRPSLRAGGAAAHGGAGPGAKLADGILAEFEAAWHRWHGGSALETPPPTGSAAAEVAAARAGGSGVLGGAARGVAAAVQRAWSSGGATAAPGSPSSAAAVQAAMEAAAAEAAAPAAPPAQPSGPEGCDPAGPSCSSTSPPLAPGAGAGAPPPPPPPGAPLAMWSAAQGADAARLTSHLQRPLPLGLAALRGFLADWLEHSYAAWMSRTRRRQTPTLALCMALITTAAWVRSFLGGDWHGQVAMTFHGLPHWLMAAYSCAEWGERLLLGGAGPTSGGTGWGGGGEARLEVPPARLVGADAWGGRLDELLWAGTVVRACRGGRSAAACVRTWPHDLIPVLRTAAAGARVSFRPQVWMALCRCVQSLGLVGIPASARAFVCDYGGDGLAEGLVSVFYQVGRAASRACQRVARPWWLGRGAARREDKRAGGDRRVTRRLPRGACMRVPAAAAAPRAAGAAGLHPAHGGRVHRGVRVAGRPRAAGGGRVEPGVPGGGLGRGAHQPAALFGGRGGGAAAAPGGGGQGGGHDGGRALLPRRLLGPHALLGVG